MSKKSLVKSQREILAENQYKDYPKETRQVIDLVTIGNQVAPVGSSKYKVFAYPLDIDLMETVEGSYLNSLRLSLAKDIQDIVRNLEKTNILFSRFQCGFDERYRLYLGKVEEGKVVDYYPEIIRRDLSNLFDQGLLDELEYDAVLKLVRSNPRRRDYYILSFFLRKKMVLDWTEVEIAQGYKYLTNKILYLDEALVSGGLVKLDVLALLPYPDIRGRKYTEVTNWIVVKLDEKLLSIVQEDRRASLKEDVVRFYNRDPLKASKRYWNFLMELEKTEDVLRELEKLAPLFSSYPAFLNSVATDLEIQKKMYSDGFLDPEDILMFIEKTQLRLRDYHPSLLYSSELNKKIILSLNENDIYEEVKLLTSHYLEENGIDMLTFVENIE